MSIVDQILITPPGLSFDEYLDLGCDLFVPIEDPPEAPKGWPCRGLGHYLCRGCAHYFEPDDDHPF